MNDDKSSVSSSDELSKYTNILIDKITKNLENFHYNVIIANLYETYNFLIKEIKKNINKEDLLKNYSKILRLMLPLIPHIISECIEDLEIKDLKNWPKVDKNFINYDNNVKIVVQINGKKRSIIEITKDIEESDIIKKVEKDKKIKQYFDKGILSKTIYIKNRLINFIIK